MLAILFYKLGVLLTRIFPEKLSSSFAAWIADIQFLVRYRSRRNVINNLRWILGNSCSPKELRLRARNVFRNFAQSVRLFLYLPRLLENNSMQDLEVSDFDNILEQLKPGRGFIIVGAHLGPWELGSLTITSRNIKMNTVVLDHPTRPVTRFFNQRRQLMRVSSYSLEQSFPLLKKALDRGECVVLLVDRSYKSMGKQYAFLGARRMLPNSHLLLAARCRVPIISGVVLLDPEHRLKSYFKGPYYIRDDLSRNEAMNEVQERCLRDLEDAIRANPEQYFHFQPLHVPMED